MTIAACYVTPEGVVLGADSTASLNTAGGFHFFNNNQKLFELGDGDATLAIVTWGLGSFGSVSLRTLFAEFSDDLKTTPPADLQAVADRWAAKAWAAYIAVPQIVADKARYTLLDAKIRHDPLAQPVDPAARTSDEEEEWEGLRRNLVAGFCIGGYLQATRLPGAFEITIQAAAVAAPVPVQIGMNTHRFWGAPSMTHRLIFGCDSAFLDRLTNSPKWTGTAAELHEIIAPGVLNHPVLPIRDAIDFIHTCIYSTIKSMKFSAMPQVCGGPIELAVVTTDRKFRWVRHKEWDAAVWENG